MLTHAVGGGGGGEATLNKGIRSQLDPIGYVKVNEHRFPVLFIATHINYSHT